MKYLLKVLGTMVYGMVSCRLIWLFFWWITPYVMSASWFWMIMYIIFALGFITSVSAFISGILSAPMFFLMGKNMSAKVVYTIICLIWGYSSCALPYNLDIEFGVRHWILAISLTLTALSVFASLIVTTFKEE